MNDVLLRVLSQEELAKLDAPYPVRMLEKLGLIYTKSEDDYINDEIIIEGNVYPNRFFEVLEDVKKTDIDNCTSPTIDYKDFLIEKLSEQVQLYEKIIKHLLGE